LATLKKGGGALLNGPASRLRFIAIKPTAKPNSMEYLWKGGELSGGETKGISQESTPYNTGQ